MRTRMRPRLVGVATIAILGLVAGILPAFAAHTPTGTTGKVDVREILARAVNQPFKVTIIHDAGVSSGPLQEGTDPINLVKVQIPSGYTATGATPPAGWQTAIPKADTLIFTEGTIAHSASADFVVSATNTTVPAVDSLGTFRAWVSQDSGATLEQVMPLTGDANSLKTTTRVLKVEGIALLSPADSDGNGPITGVTDNSVTAGQQNVQSRCTVRNVGSGTPTVSAALTGPFTATGGGPQTITANSTADFPFELDFNNSAGSFTANCSASATGASTPAQFQANLPITVQAVPAFTYVGGSLDPKAGPPGAVVSFKVQVTQTAGAAAKAILDQAATQLCLDRTPCATLKNPVVIDPGKTALLEFTPVTLPALISGSVEKLGLTLAVAGIDDNTVAFSSAPAIGDKFRLDFSVPQVVATLTGPASQVTGEAPAVKQEGGDALGAKVEIKDTDEFGNLVLCGECVLEAAFLRQYSDKDGTQEIPGKDIALNMSCSGGTCTFTYTGAFDLATRAVRLFATARDTAGLRNSGSSAAFEVDALKPGFISALTGIDVLTGERRSLKVRLNKPVTGTCNVADWSVDDNVVVSCSNSPNSTNPVTEVTLTTAQPFKEDPPLGSVHYKRNMSISAGYKDRVARLVPDVDLTILDGIAPAAPQVQSVSTGSPSVDLGQQDGAFYTNGGGPAKTADFLLVGSGAIQPGYTGQLFRESNEIEGLQTGGASPDEQIGSRTAQVAASVRVPATLANFPEGDNAKSKVYAVALDTASPPNISLATVVDVVFDQTAPDAATARAEVTRIVVTFSEPLAVGRNFAIDYEIRIDDGTPEGAVVQPRTVSGSAMTRELNISSPDYNKDAVRSVEYLYFGPSADRYKDRARNDLFDYKLQGVEIIAV